MKKFIFRIFLIILFFLISLIIILSTIGIETQRFNRLISEKIVESDKRLSVQLEKIKFKFDVKNFNLFIETKNPILNYQNLVIPIKNIKAYLDFFSIIKSKPIIEKINFSSEEIDIVELKKLIVKTKPSNLNSLVINKIEKGKLTLNMELYFDKNLKLDNFISRGEVKEMEAKLDKNTSLKKTSFTFFADKSDILIKNISSQMANSLIKNGNLKIRKEDTVKIESDFVTEIKIDKRNINQYLPYLKNFQLINENTILNAKLENFLEINFDKTFKVIDYSYKNKGDIDNLILKMTQSIVQRDGFRASECFTEDGVYHDVFYGSFAKPNIPKMVEDYFHRDATDFIWDIFDPISAGSIGYARYVFSYDSKLADCDGKRAVFEGIARCELRDGLLLSYHEVADAFTGLSQLGFSGDRLKKIAAAASISILIGLSIFLQFYNNSKNVNNSNIIEIGSNKAILTLENGDEVILEKGKKYER